ncbi:MAG: MOSC domain-containing protein [Deltaproteobacteria bacterium]|nr:MOSC domain-containing protein [Deltaproteobacteria bacterium]
MGKIVAVCKSKEKGTKKGRVDAGFFRENYGLVGDAHADPQTHRQVSLLSVKSINKMQSLGVNVGYGDFAENITTEGIDLVCLPIGARLLVGDEVFLEVTQIGKECHTGCAIFRQIGKCIMPKEGIFARVIQGGFIRAGDTIKAITRGRKDERGDEENSYPAGL